MSEGELSHSAKTLSLSLIGQHIFKQIYLCVGGGLISFCESKFSTESFWCSVNCRSVYLARLSIHGIQTVAQLARENLGLRNIKKDNITGHASNIGYNLLFSILQYLFYNVLINQHLKFNTSLGRFSNKCTVTRQVWLTSVSGFQYSFW